MYPAAATFILASLAATFVSASPLDIWDPPVLYPNADTVWVVGNYHNVTWSTANPPAHISNGAAVYLAKGGVALSPTPLAANFSLLAGRVVIQVPDVPAGDEYQIILFGDSGDLSAEFTIVEA